MFFPKIQSISGFIRKFNIVQDTPKINWAEEIQDIIATGIKHSDLVGIGANDHHLKLHAASHTGLGNDALKLPFEMRTEDGALKFKFDADGNIFLKGRVLNL